MNPIMTSTTACAEHPILAESERQRCEIWTRVMGYHRPVSSFNTGKKGEFAERVYFKEPAKARVWVAPQASNDDCILT